MIDRYREAFREEAYELVAELESALLELEQRPDDSELIQRTFRALHTIKGAGAMFGFDELSRFTHDIETAFDRVREGSLAVTDSLITLTLAARDEIKATLDDFGHTGMADAGRSADILEQFRALTGALDASPAVSPPRPGSESEPCAQAGADAGPARRWRIGFRPARTILLRGTNPLLLLRELGGLGELEVTVDTGAIPGLSQMDPESCYLEWDLVLTTGQGIDAIRDVFIFVEDECELAIEPLDAAEPAASEKTEDGGSPETGAPATGASAGIPRSNGASTSIRVSADKLDSLVNFVGELVVVQARLSRLASRQNDQEVVFIAEEVERLTAELRDNAMSIRMLPLRATFDRFRRLVHDLTRELGKEVEFTTEGTETELDKTVIDQLSDPLLHLVRNSMDHGIEPPAERLAAGKPRAGRLQLSAIHSGANVLIRVSDDGRGLNAEAVRARAIEKGLIPPDAQLSESDVFSLILMPGFSTAQQVTDLSGRGVGMDVVRRSVEMLRGTVDIASRPSEGTTVTLRLPLTLAIIDGLLIRVGGAHFVAPLASVVECVELSQEDVRRAHSRRMAVVRGDLVPYIRLREHFLIPGEPPEIEQIMIVETDAGRYGFVVDEVLGDHQTVIKNLGRFYSHVHVLSGATILGDGTVALILDPQRLVQNAIRSGRSTRNTGQAILPADPEVA